MTGTAGMAYAQARIQSRYGSRADATVWLKLQNIHDLGSYLQTAQQTPLRHWILGISATHSSHEIELTLRQKYRGHIDEVANWVPASWRRPLHWLKRIHDLPAMQYLATGGTPLEWMKKDPDLADFTDASQGVRVQAMREAGCSSLVDALHRDGNLLEGWMREWHRIRPRSKHRDQGFAELERLVYQLILSQTRAHTHAHSEDDVLPADYDAISKRFRRIFRRHAFQPASVFAYLAIIMIDLHRIRSDLIQRHLFADTRLHTEDLPI
jgi:hypothetical protein